MSAILLQGLAGPMAGARPGVKAAHRFGPADGAALAAHLLRRVPVAASLEPWMAGQLERLLAGGFYFSEAMDLGLARRHQETHGWSGGGFRTFVYHRASRLVYFDNPPGTHSHLMAILAALHRAGDTLSHPDPQQGDLVRAYAADQRDPVSELAEHYRARRLGFFLSSQGRGRPCLPRGFEETSEETDFLEAYPGTCRV